MNISTAVISTVSSGTYYDCSIQFYDYDAFQFFNRWHSEEVSYKCFIEDMNQEYKNRISNLNSTIHKKQNWIRHHKRLRPWFTKEEKDVLSEISLLTKNIKKLNESIIDMDVCNLKSFNVKKKSMENFLHAWGFQLVSITTVQGGQSYVWKLNYDEFY